MSPSLSTVRRLITVAALASATIAVTPHSASASPTLGGFDVRAAPERPTATPPAYFNLSLSAGRSVTREVSVGNSTRRPLRLSGAKPISYGAKSMRVGAAGGVVVRVKADARLARRCRARPGKRRYFGRLAYRAVQHRFVVRFPMRLGRR
jgi:hypothetical protein